MTTCGRCGWTAPAPYVRDRLANREQEARQDGRPFTPPAYAIEPRCDDRAACRARAKEEPRA